MRKAKYFKSNNGKFEIVTWNSWGQAGDENGSYPVAIVERHDGSVIVVDADRLQFCEPTVLE